MDKTFKFSQSKLKPQQIQKVIQNATKEKEYETENIKLKKKIEELKRQLKEKNDNESKEENENVLEMIENIKNQEDGKLIKVIFKKLCILKEMNEQNIKSKKVQGLIDKYKIMRMLTHQNIHKVYDIFIDYPKFGPSILFEYCPTNLEDSIKNKKLSKVQQVFNIYQIAEGMKYIHSCKIVHQNLNPSNILISENGTIKISGFEKCEDMKTIDDITKLELREMEDVYSFGEIVYFILTEGEYSKHNKEIVLKSFSMLSQLIEACWSTEPECRPTFEIICDVLNKNNFKLISLTNEENKEISQMINQYKAQYQV